MTYNENKYGGLIEKLRNTHNISQDALANILLINTDTLVAVEKGETFLTDSQLNMCANIFNVSKFALGNGEIRPQIKHTELQFNLDRLIEQYKEAMESQTFMLEMIQDITPPERYKAQYSDVQEYDIYGYFVYDALKEDFVRDDVDMPLKYDTAKEALEAAKEMEEQYKSKKTEKEKVVDSTDKNAAAEQPINNINDEMEDIAVRL